MIITRTPLRISLVGGGTDLPAFYKHSFGAVVSFAINKYVYTMVNEKFGGGVRVSYSKTENVKGAMDLKHDIIRESLLAYDMEGVEVVTVADVPGAGTGLGSSSALAVGLVKCLRKYIGNSDNVHPKFFAERAYEIEREMCLHQIGKQDHYASSYGNLHYYQFNSDDKVSVELLKFEEHELREFASRFTLLWTNRTRSSNDILKRQEANMSTDRRRLAEEMRDMAVYLLNDLRKHDTSSIGEYLNTNWGIKRQMAQGITNDWIDRKIQAGLAAGAEGGKLCGAGGGGFLLFYGPLGIRPELEKATGLQHVPFEIDTEGCKVIYEDEA